MDGRRRLDWLAARFREHGRLEHAFRRTKLETVVYTARERQRTAVECVANRIIDALDNGMIDEMQGEQLLRACTKDHVCAEDEHAIEASIGTPRRTSSSDSRWSDVFEHIINDMQCIESEGGEPVRLHQLLILTVESVGDLRRLESYEALDERPLTELAFGRPVDAAIGLNAWMGLPDRQVHAGMARGIEAIVDEFARCGTEEDLMCLAYVLYAPTGSCTHAFPNGRMDAMRRPGALLEDFAAHPSAREAGLELEHVLALRLYTTACYKSLNGPLRDAARGPRTSCIPREPQRCHPFPITITFLSEGIKRLRAVGVHRSSSSASSSNGATTPRDLWRGLRNVELGEEFQLTGGTEVNLGVGFEPDLTLRP